MILKIEDVHKSYLQGGSREALPVLKGVSFEVKKGDTVAITGQSGSGKTTMLSLLAGLDNPTEGSIILAEKDLKDLDEDELAKFRARHIGIIFQQFHLMPHLTALENVKLPLEILKEEDVETKAQSVLTEVGLEGRTKHFPGQLSGGECQRVAIARALAVRPQILLADEPTGNLDNKTGNQVADLLFELVKSTGMTLLMVTHNPELAERTNRTLRLVNGNLA